MRKVIVGILLMFVFVSMSNVFAYSRYYYTHCGKRTIFSPIKDAISIVKDNIKRKVGNAVINTTTAVNDFTYRHVYPNNCSYYYSNRRHSYSIRRSSRKPVYTNCSSYSATYYNSHNNCNYNSYNYNPNPCYNSAYYYARRTRPSSQRTCSRKTIVRYRNCSGIIRRCR
jgi:hypothetical protein